jgi:ATP-dependent DNA helicase RecQ
LRQVGVRAAFLNSTLDAAAARAVESTLANGGLDLLYVAPERLLTSRCLDLLSRAPLALFRDRRGALRVAMGPRLPAGVPQLSVLHERFPGVPRIALTATADPQTRAEIVARLALDGARVSSRASTGRTSATPSSTRTTRARSSCASSARSIRRGGHRLLPVAQEVDETAAWLRAQGIAALPYHAAWTRRAAANQARSSARTAS